MKYSRALVVGVALQFGCGGAAHEVNLPPPVQSTTLGAGDAFEFRIVGEDKIPTEYVVAPDGTANLPFIHQTRVEGLEPQQIEKKVHDERFVSEGSTPTPPSPCS